MGLKPYGEWNGKYHSKDQLIAAINKKLTAFPGIIFNYTQPAEDAVDEALTGLKASLDVKVFGTDLTRAGAKGARNQGVHREGPAGSITSRSCRSSGSRASRSRSTGRRWRGTV